MSGMRNCKNKYRAISICIDYHTDSKDCKTDMLFIAYHTTFEYYCEVMDEQERILSFMNDLFVPEGGKNNA